MVPVPRVRRVPQYGIGSVVPEPASRLRAWRRIADRIARLLTTGGSATGQAPAAVAAAARVEPKGITVALHDRGVPPAAMPALRRALRSVTAEAGALGFEPIRGTRVTEFVPRRHGKARGLRALLRGRGAAAQTVFYWGDSEADEAAFAALGARHFSIKVGAGPTRAGHRVDGPRDAARFLASIVRFRGR